MLCRHNLKVLALLVCILTACVANAEAAGPLRIHMISGSNEYESEASLKKLKESLEADFTIECTASWSHDGAQQLENLAALAEADLLIVFARRLKLPESQMKQIRDHWQAGKPVIGIRTASHAFQQADNEIFDRQVLGGHYKGHFGNEPVKVTVRPEAADHPILAGVGPFESTKLYKVGELPKDTVVLQLGNNGKAEQAVTLVHEYRGGRMFFTALGVPSDFENRHFRTLLHNAVFWTTKQSAEELRK